MEDQKKPLPRNVILDLLPAYISGEASEETRIIIEEYAQKDQDIARLIQAGILDSEKISSQVPAPDHLEMMSLKRIRTHIRRQLIYVALITTSILMIPFIAMMFTDEVNWTASDFAVMGLILIGTGLTYVFISSKSTNKAYKFAVGIAILAGLLLIWSNLAVGIIGSETNPLNILYFGVFIVGITGAWVSRFQSRGMATAMLLSAATQMLIPVVALIIDRPTLDEPPGILGVFILNLIFAAMFTLSAVLFRFAAKRNDNK